MRVEFAAGATLFLLGCAALVARAEGPVAPVAAPDTRNVAGQVADAAGKPLRGVVVFAADASTDKVVAVAVSDDAGQVGFSLPARRHNFGVLSPALGIARFIPRGPDSFALLVQPLPGEAAGPAQEGAPALASEWITAAGALVIRGQITDELGVGLGGVRVEAVRPSGALAGTALSEGGGRFGFAVPGGVFRLRPSAPGLKPSKITTHDGRVTVVMSVAADVQRVAINAGHVLSFRLEDSIDPEYSPPGPVRAWLLFAYGICANSGPLRAHERRELKKYWYLELLRQQPPNPATITTTSCTPPTMYDQAPRTLTDGFGDLPGF